MDAVPSEPGSTLHTHAVDSQRRAAALGDGNRVLSRTQKVYVALRDDIVRTRLAPGEVVLEPELAARFGVSKTPVREALQILVVEGLVVALPRRGYVVRPLGITEVREVLDLRLIIEPPMAATRYGSEAFVEELGSILDAQRGGSGTAELTDAARAFHECILGAARNARAKSLMSGLFDETTRSHHLIPAIDARIHSEVENDGHQQVLEAIRTGDPQAAEAAMRRHLAELREFVLQAFLEA
ncbi:GntR family transcriptional regulator [Agromyces mediolanus]|uniref:Transcriptional regulator n=1 Tax=Agromyces mediolanus TaxID=41986 RepID=A0A918CFG4_AGRME|nr:GntR family transcriptional regulator [Agromyces mediolanus]GGR19384.1 transcriptional regulator [Agromyces mediolanus]GLJ71312.1 transcriptional regulator [Agromyces mediolanus]